MRVDRTEKMPELNAQYRLVMATLKSPPKTVVITK